MGRLHLGNTRGKLRTENKEPGKAHDTAGVIGNDQKCGGKHSTRAGRRALLHVFVQDENISQVISQYHS